MRDFCSSPRDPETKDFARSEFNIAFSFEYWYDEIHVLPNRRPISNS